MVFLNHSGVCFVSAFLFLFCESLVEGAQQAFDLMPGFGGVALESCVEEGFGRGSVQEGGI